MKIKYIGIALVVFLVATGCTKLDEKLQGDVTFDEARANADINGLLKACYTSMRGPYQDQTGIWCLQDMTTDDAIGPTRGGDWDDNGVWRVLHEQKWDADNQRIRDNFNNLLTIVFNTTNVLFFQPAPGIEAEALALRAYVMFTVLDLYDQVPFREPGENLLNPSQVLKGTDALNKIIEDLDKAMPNLPDGPATKANKWMAKALLMKAYLNKGVYANRAAPTFDAADMQKVISLGNEIIASGKFAIDDDFYLAFTPKNTQTSKDLLFVNENSREEAGNVRFHWFAGTHYNQTPSGWNGFTTLASFYDKFEDADQRKGRAYTGITDLTGMRVGFLVGQQFDEAGKPLTDRGGKPLIFTREVSSVITGNVETPGIRVVKYVPDMKDKDNPADPAENDYVLLRFADVVLMMAEANLRTNNSAAALTLVNQVRAKRGASPMTSIDLTKLLDERGRELYWESWRRNDLVRFGKFLDPFGTTKPTKTDVKYLIFPIPSNALAVNPNLAQNPGY